MNLLFYKDTLVYDKAIHMSLKPAVHWLRIIISLHEHCFHYCNCHINSVFLGVCFIIRVALLLFSFICEIEKKRFYSSIAFIIQK